LETTLTDAVAPLTLANGTVYTGTADISIPASGTTKLYIDGQLMATSTTDTLTYSWDTSGLRKGSHSIWISSLDGKTLTKTYYTVKVN
jgi:hypothetical protein